MTTIVVAAAVVERDGRFLVTRRPKGVHLEGCWEFPGGKCDAGEPLPLCLARELREELDVEARIGGEIFTITHAYPERTVALHFFRCDLQGEPRPQLGQEMRWVRREEMAALEFPPADVELIRMLGGTDVGNQIADGRSTKGSGTTEPLDSPTTTFVPGSTKSRCT